jgi:hypothetical protein
MEMNKASRIIGLFETYTPEDVDVIVPKFQDSIQAPFVKVYKSTLGGVQNTSILLTVSLDPKEAWSYGILENSRYFKMHYYQDGTLELFSGGRGLTKFRKTRTKNPEDSLEKINKYISLQGEPK